MTHSSLRQTLWFFIHRFQTTFILCQVPGTKCLCLFIALWRFTENLSGSLSPWVLMTLIAHSKQWRLFFWTLWIFFPPEDICLPVIYLNIIHYLLNVTRQQMWPLTYCCGTCWLTPLSVSQRTDCLAETGRDKPSVSSSTHTCSCLLGPCEQTTSYTDWWFSPSSVQEYCCIFCSLYSRIFYIVLWNEVYSVLLCVLTNSIHFLFLFYKKPGTLR